MQRKSNQVNVFEVKIVIDVVEHLLWDKMKASCDLIWFLLCIFLFSMFLKFGWSRKRKTKKVVAQHIPFWVECMFLVETPYCSDVWRQFKHPSDLSVCWDAYQFLNQSSLNTVIFRILVVRLFCWSPKCDSATVGEKREWRKEKNERKENGMK